MPCDYSKYPSNWKEIRKRILARAGNCCEVCKVPNGEYVLRGKFGEVDAYQNIDQIIYSAVDGTWLSDGRDFDVVECDINAKAIKIVLTIAHLDHDASNHDVTDDRLQAMCQKCHNNYDKEFRTQNRRQTLTKKKKQIQLF